MTKAPEAAKTGKETQVQTPAVIDKTLADSVLNKVKVFTANKDLRLPPDYSPENALKSAWLILIETKTSKSDGERPVLQVCSKDSIANSLLKMVLLGLNPAKGQCDFIAYGTTLSCDPSYFGNLALAKRLSGVKDIVPTIVYEGDVFEYEILPNGYKRVTKHIQSFENIDVNKIRGGYATVLFEDSKEEPYVEIMTMTQIRQAWQMGAMKGNSPAHKNFPDQMAGKTVISRAAKRYINSSDDSDLGLTNGDQRSIESKQQIAENANKEEITMDVKAEVIEEKKENPPETTQPQAIEVVPTAGSSSAGAIPGF